MDDRLNNSYYIKACLLSYYRFSRGYICVDECDCYGISDIMVDTGRAIYDIEVKVSKSDLINGEAKKYKHKAYKNLKGKKFTPNKFYICIPKFLQEVAEQWVEETNDKYGIIIYHSNRLNYQHDFVNVFNFLKPAKSLNNIYSGEFFKERIGKRLSSSLANKMQKDIIKIEHKYKQGVKGE